MRKYSSMLAVAVVVFFLSVSFAQAAPERIVSLVPSITENLFALGVGDKVVGVTTWCNYPLEAAERVAVGDAFNLNLEVLLSLEPDLVVGDDTLVHSYLEQLTELGIPVFAVAPTNLQEVMDSLVSLGEAVGAEEQGERLAGEMAHRLDSLLASVPSGKKPRVFVEIWNEPLSTVGPGSFIDELISLAGGENIAADTGNPWPQFSEELVIARDPEVLILTNFNKDDVLNRTAWQDLSAVRSGRIYEVDSDIYVRTTPRLLDALEELIEIFHSIE